MSLINRPFYFNRMTDNYVASSPNFAVSPITASAGANNVDGTESSVMLVDHDIHYLILCLFDSGSPATYKPVLVDILYDTAGGTNWSELIGDLVCGFTAGISSGGSACIYHFPLWVPAGTRLGVRARTGFTSNSIFRIAATALGEPSRPDAWWCGQKVESLGINPSLSEGTYVTPGASNAWGDWTNIGTPTSARYGAIQSHVNGPGDGVSTDIAYHWQLGHGSQPLPGFPTYWYRMTSSEIAHLYGNLYPNFCDIPKGTQMQLRSKTGNSTPEDFNAAIYGVY